MTSITQIFGNPSFRAAKRSLDVKYSKGLKALAAFLSEEEFAKQEKIMVKKYKDEVLALYGNPEKVLKAAEAKKAAIPAKKKATAKKKAPAKKAATKALAGLMGGEAETE
jgi:hypothetical protein